MHIIEINLIGVMYTLKLAIHYFRRRPVSGDRDRCFIFGGSIAGYVDNLASHLCTKHCEHSLIPCVEQLGVFSLQIWSKRLDADC